MNEQSIEQLKKRIEELKKDISNIIDVMEDKWYDGGMDMSYSGHNYESAREEAIEKLADYITNNTPSQNEIEWETRMDVKRKAKIVFDQPYGTPRIDWNDSPLTQSKGDKE